MDFKEHFTERVGITDGDVNMLRMQIFIAFATLVHKKGRRNMDCKVLDTSKYTLPIPLNKIVHHRYGQMEFVCPFVKYEFDYFKNTKDLANLYDCLVEEMEKYND